MIYIIIFLLSVFISSFSQILLKMSANCKHSSLLEEYLNPRTIIAYSIFFASSLMTVYAYKGVPLSMGPVVEASGYIWVTILGKMILEESIPVKKLVGLCFIVLGIFIFSGV